MFEPGMIHATGLVTSYDVVAVFPPAVSRPEIVRILETARAYEIASQGIHRSFAESGGTDYDLSATPGVQLWRSAERGAVERLSRHSLDGDLEAIADTIAELAAPAANPAGANP